MIIGVPREIKPQEDRVSMTPAGVDACVRAGHEVVIESGAGAGSGFTDEEYVRAGATILKTAQETFEKADMIVKVKEPLPAEIPFLKENQTVFTYFHLAPDKELTDALLRAKIIGIAYETVQLPNGALPLLSPMSEIAGRMAVQVGAFLLERTNGGRGVLLGGVSGVEKGKVVIVGGGNVGASAAKIALGMGAQVTVLDLSGPRLAYLDDIFGSRLQTLMSNSYNIEAAVKDADLVIGAVLVPGSRTPKLVKEYMVKQMKPGAVLVDVAIDQGGCGESSHVTTHDDPVYIEEGVVHYCVGNMPGAVPRTSTIALTNATLKYGLQIAANGLEKAAKDNPAIALGVNCYCGKLTNKNVADAHKYDYTALDSIIM